MPLVTKPVYLAEPVKITSPSSNTQYYKHFWIQKNELQTYDSIIPSDKPTYKAEYLSLDYSFDGSQYSEDTYLIYNFQFSENRLLHVRSCYNILDFIGNIGGVLDIFVLVFGVFFSPISQFSFMIRALQKIYKVQTSKDRHLFVGCSHKKHDGSSQHIQISPQNFVKLFIF